MKSQLARGARPQTLVVLPCSSTASIKRLPRLACWMWGATVVGPTPTMADSFPQEVAANNLSSHFSYHCINIRVRKQHG